MNRDRWFIAMMVALSLSIVFQAAGIGMGIWSEYCG